MTDRGHGWRAAALLAALAVGCGGPAAAPKGSKLLNPAKPAAPVAEKLYEGIDPEGKGPIFGRKTQNIGEFDPAAGRVVSDSSVKVTNPITGPLEAYGPMMEKIGKLHIEHALRLYEAEKGYYPRTHQEFMDGIIKANDIKLPVLPAGATYQYDVKNHKLVVVKAAGAPPG